MGQKPSLIPEKHSASVKIQMTPPIRERQNTPFRLLEKLSALFTSRPLSPLKIIKKGPGPIPLTSQRVPLSRGSCRRDPTRPGWPMHLKLLVTCDLDHHSTVSGYSFYSTGDTVAFFCNHNQLYTKDKHVSPFLITPRMVPLLVCYWPFCHYWPFFETSDLRTKSRIKSRATMFCPVFFYTR